MPEEDSGGGGGRGNFLTRKVGPIPMWGWIAAVGVGVAVFVLKKRAQAASSATGTGTTATAGATAAPDVFGASGYSGGQQVGGYDSSSSDSFLQSLQGQLATIQSGVPLSAQGVNQVQGVVSTTPSPVAVPNPTNAPITASNPIDAYIEAQYQNEAGRASDPSGLTYWRNIYLTQGPQAEAQQFQSTVTANKARTGAA